MSTTLELRISGTFSLKVRPSTVTVGAAPAPLHQHAHAFARDAAPDAVIDVAAGENDLRRVAGLLGAMGEVIRIDADAVAADQPRIERQEIPFGARRREHVAGIDAERVADRGQLVHERDVEIALGVLDHLGGLGDLDRRRAMDAGRHGRAVDRGDDVERLRRPAPTPPW